MIDKPLFKKIVDEQDYRLLTDQLRQARQLIDAERAKKWPQLDFAGGTSKPSAASPRATSISDRDHNGNTQDRRPDDYDPSLQHRHRRRGRGGDELRRAPVRVHVRQGRRDPQDRIAIVTGGIGLGASRMSGSDKQTYYKMGTSPTVADSADGLRQDAHRLRLHARRRRACRGRSARCGSSTIWCRPACRSRTTPRAPTSATRPTTTPIERATSAGPKTSKFMSECLQAQADRYGIRIFDRQEAAHLLTSGEGDGEAHRRRRHASTSTPRRRAHLRPDGVPLREPRAGGRRAGRALRSQRLPARPDRASTASRSQPGLAAHNLTESQFGLASTKFRWNVSGTYMQVVPRIFSHRRRRRRPARVPRAVLPDDREDGHQHLPQRLPVAVRPAADPEPAVVADRRAGLPRNAGPRPAGVHGLHAEPDPRRRQGAVRPGRDGRRGARPTSSATRRCRRRRSSGWST